MFLNHQQQTIVNATQTYTKMWMFVHLHTYTEAKLLSFCFVGYDIVCFEEFVVVMSHSKLTETINKETGKTRKASQCILLPRLYNKMC